MELSILSTSSSDKPHDGGAFEAQSRWNFDLLTHQDNVYFRDGPKFGRRRSSAEEFGRMFSSATLDYSAEFENPMYVLKTQNSAN